MTRKRALAVVAVLIVVIGAALVLARRGSDNHRVSVTTGETSTTTTFTTTSTSTSSTAGSAQSQDSTSSTESIKSTTESSTDAPDDSTSTTVPPPPYGPNALLIATNEGDHQTVWAVNPDGTGQTRLLDSAHVADIGWLPGHQQFAWGEPSSTQGVGELHVVNVDGSGDHVLEQRPPENEPLTPWHGQWWSPDGRYVAELCHLEESNQTWQPLCILDTQTGQLRDLTAEFGLIESGDVGADGLKPWFYPLSWDPTGHKLVYARAPENPTVHMDVLDVTTGEHWTIASEPSLMSAVVTGDGQSVLYERQDAVGGLQQLPITGGTAQPINGLIPGFRSPDGQWYLSRMYYGEVGADPPGPAQIFNLAGETRQIPVAGGNVTAAAW